MSRWGVCVGGGYRWVVCRWVVCGCVGSGGRRVCVGGWGV